jgi:hypothetical protein
MIVKCLCKHQYQDGVHGPGMRVANKSKGPSPGDTVYRCTVCKREHTKTVKV